MKFMTASGVIDEASLTGVATCGAAMACCDEGGCGAAFDCNDAGTTPGELPFGGGVKFGEGCWAVR